MEEKERGRWEGRVVEDEQKWKVREGTEERCSESKRRKGKEGSGANEGG